MTSGISPGIVVQHLALSYPQGRVLEDISFSVPAGGTLAIAGPSGCGKSTLLSLLAGLLEPESGVISLMGRQSGKPVRTAFVMQDFGLFPWKTVQDNLVLPLKLAGVSGKEARERAYVMLEELGLRSVAGRFPLSLSGGQRQRVALGRALITDPEVLLLDEPFSALDALTREYLQQLVYELWTRRGFTCVLVTHSIEEAVFLGQHVMALRGTPARCVLWADNPAFGAHQDSRSLPEAAMLAARIRRALVEQVTAQ